jgi:hypothetical protein
LAAVAGQRTFVYPPILLWLDLPLSVFPHDLARVLFTLLSVAAVLGALRIMGVTDHRVFACVLLSATTVNALVFGNPTILLMPVLAAAWVWRDRPWAVGAAVALLVAAKPLLFPIGLWLLVTRRFRATLIAGGMAAAALLVTWAAIGFHGMADYPALVRLVGDTTAGPRGYSIANLMHGLGAARTIGTVVQTAAGLALLASLPFVQRGDGGDRRAFAVALAAALVASPVVWLHYLALLFVPLAAARPAYDGAWSASRLLWIAAFLPQSAHYVIVRNGHVFHNFGHVPSPGRIAVSLAFLAGITAAASWRTTRAPRTQAVPATA